MFTIGKAKVMIADKKTATDFWAPRLAPSSGFSHFDASPAVPSILVGGPYLVRSASIQGSNLALQGDLNATTGIDIFAPNKIKTVTSKKLSFSKYGSHADMFR